MKSIIENITFRVGGFFGSDYFNIAVNRDGTSRFYHESFSGDSILPGDVAYSKADTSRFLKEFEETGVFTWKRYYQPDFLVTDGIQWSVEVERRGRRKFIREGDNLFPPRWGSFCALFGIWLNEIKTARLELMLNRTAALPDKQDGSFLMPVRETVLIDFDTCRVKAECYKNRCKTFQSDVVSESRAFETLNDDISRLLTHEWRDEPWQPDAADVPFFSLNVTLYDGSTGTHSGIYDKNHTPGDWRDAMNGIRRFVPDDGYFALLDSEGPWAAKEEEYRTFYSVEILGMNRDYYYFSHDGTLNVGDNVLVPFGWNNELHFGEIIGIERFSPDDLPFPAEKMKFIERRSTPDEATGEKTVYCPVIDGEIDGGCCMIICDVADGYIKSTVLWDGVEWDEGKRRECLACEWHSDRVKHNEKYNSADQPQPGFTEQDAVDAHRFSSSNKPELSKGEKCGCFNCLKIFNSKEITEYLTGDNDCDRKGTAVCPHCGIDSVIGESSGYPITPEFLIAMSINWF